MESTQLERTTFRDQVSNRDIAVSLVRITGDGSRYHDLALIIDGKVKDSIQYRHITDGQARKHHARMAETIAKRYSRAESFVVAYRDQWSTRTKEKKYKTMKAALKYAALYNDINEGSRVTIGPLIIGTFGSLA